MTHSTHLSTKIRTAFDDKQKRPTWQKIAKDVAIWKNHKVLQRMCVTDQERGMK